MKIVYTREENSICTRQAHAMTTRSRPGWIGTGRLWPGIYVSYRRRGIAPPAPSRSPCRSSAWNRPTAWTTFVLTGIGSSRTDPSGACSASTAVPSPAGVDLQLDDWSGALSEIHRKCGSAMPARPGDTHLQSRTLPAAGVEETIRKNGKKSPFKEKLASFRPFHGIGIGVIRCRRASPWV